jgi:hypothetical protein
MVQIKTRTGRSRAGLPDAFSLAANAAKITYLVLSGYLRREVAAAEP